MTLTPIPLYSFSSYVPLAPTSSVASTFLGSWNEYKLSDTKTSNWVRRIGPKAWPFRQLKIATWNVWFDATLCELRWKTLIENLGEEGPDIVCLQEVTPKFQDILLAHHVTRSTYLTTYLSDETTVTGSRYGTIILVKRTLVYEKGCEVSATFEGYEGSKCARGLSMLKVKMRHGGVTLVGNTHLEYNPLERKRQMEFCISRLSQLPPPLPSPTLAAPEVTSFSKKKKAAAPSSIEEDKEPEKPPVEALELGVLCGDTNIESYAEIEENFIRKGWRDIFVIAEGFSRMRPLPAEAFTMTASPSEDAPSKLTAVLREAQVDLFTDIPSFGVAGLKFKDKLSKERIARLDYILAKVSPGAPPLPSPSPPTPLSDPTPASADVNDDSESDSELAAVAPYATGSYDRRVRPLTKVHARNAKFMGAERIPYEVVKRLAKVDDEEMSVWPSDHLGVVASVWVGP
ncbi:hypothetical protein DL93DRAFT_2099553 [Clavulina sp. PMI_390]|nr:hypothetical protein DL93DRAFT_2099553 [Clavulina sp. PMI_390]